jgi:hypothetical protein
MIMRGEYQMLTEGQMRVTSIEKILKVWNYRNGCRSLMDWQTAPLDELPVLIVNWA